MTTCGTCGEWQYGGGIVGPHPERDRGFCLITGERQRGEDACAAWYKLGQPRPTGVVTAIDICKRRREANGDAT